LASVVGAVTGGVAGIAVGQAASVALDPVFEPVKQDAWKKKATKILEAPQLAQLVAEALNSVSDVIDDVNRNGYDSDEFQSLVQLALKAPGPPDAERLYLRQKADPAGSITKAMLEHAYGKAGIEYQFWAALTAAAETALLTPAQLALGVVRGTVPDAGLMVVTLDTADSNVPKYTPAALNTLNEAAAAGFNEERMRALVGSIGLPMSTHEAASAYFRQIITLGGFNQSILEGDVRPEWAPFILEQARQILTAHDWVEGRLRGWVPDDQAMYAGTALHGMSQADTDLLFKITGRPLNIHQIVTAQARGGTYKGPIDAIPEEYLAAVRESNIRPEFYNLDYANRYTYPSGFQIKAETKDHTLTEQASYDLLLKVGWEPDLAALFSKAWYAPTTTTAPHVKSAQTQAITKVKQAYVGGSYGNPEAIAALTALDVASTDQPTIIKYWDEIRKAEAAITAAVRPPGP
jgi:hypothetical protein